jgi:uncharacterized protein
MDIQKEEIKKDAQVYFEGVVGSHDWDHVERVYNLSIHIGEKEGANLEILSLAAYLHDVGRFEQDKTKGGVCHAKHGSKLSRKILEKHGFSGDIVQKVVDCIEAHRLSSKKEHKSLESKVLFDADTIDSLGAIGLGRMFSFAGSFGHKVHNKGVDISINHEYTIEDTPYWYFMNRGKDVLERIMTKEGKRLAEARYKFMKEFFEQINKEVEGMR